MQALGRPLAGYTNVTPDYAERARAFRARGPATMDGDRADLEIEDFGLAENLMIEVAIVSSGCRVVRRAVAAGAELTDLAAFVECLADIAASWQRNRRRSDGVRPSCSVRHRGTVA